MEMLFQAAPVATVILIITIILSLIGFYNESWLRGMMLHPYSVAHGRRLYTVLTSGFIHRDWVHLLFNMMTYYFFAFQLEANYLGHWQFGLLYIASIILSDLPTVNRYRDNYLYYSLGASGAISAVLFSFILFNPMVSMYMLFIPIPIKAIVFGGLYLVYCVYASRQSRDTINHDAHFFGAISGIMITILLYHEIVPYFIRQLGF